MKNLLIAPSTDPCPIKDLTEYAKLVEKSGADWLHCDIMDGKFVPKRSFDYLVFAFLRKATNLFLDVHLMVNEPMKVVKDYVKYGANSITIHYESFSDKVELINALQTIRGMGVKVGLSIKPDTPVQAVENLLRYIDILLVMSVYPGKSGQEFIQDSLIKISYLSKKKAELGLDILIEVDGGVNFTNASIISVSGADVLVSGSCIYNAKDKKKAIETLKGKDRL